MKFNLLISLRYIRNVTKHNYQIHNIIDAKPLFSYLPAGMFSDTSR